MDLAHRHPRRAAAMVATILALAAALAGIAPAAAGAADAELALQGVTSIDAGRRHTCTPLTDRRLRCWGDNNTGQLGDDSGVAQSRPVLVTNRTGTGPLTGVVEVVGGAGHTCARLTNGEARCWGANARGQLGNGSTTPSSRPVIVTKAGGGRLTGVVGLAGGDSHTCAELGTGRVRCWGGNTQFQIASPNSDRLRATLVRNGAGTAPLGGVVEVGAGDWHTCARLSSGQLRCWGANDFGQLGDGTVVDRILPVPVVNTSATGPLTGVTQLSSGVYGTCARVTGGQARCWGLNDQGQVGDGTTVNRTRPTPVSNATDSGPLTNVARVAAGNLHTCALLTSSQVRCWGNGGLGDDTFVPSLLPVTVVNRTATGPLTGVEQVAPGDFHTCATLGSGQARCWGSDAFSQLGNGPAAGGARPVVVSVS